MHDPTHVAFEIKRPWPCTPRNKDGSPGTWHYYPSIATFWHTNPKGHDSGAPGGCCPFRPKLNAEQDEVIKSIASWEHQHPYYISRPNVGPGDASALAVDMFSTFHWRLKKKPLPVKLFMAAFLFGTNSVDNCQNALSQPFKGGDFESEVTWQVFKCNRAWTEAQQRYGEKGERNPVAYEDVEQMVRMFMGLYIRAQHRWYHRICWNPLHYHVQIPWLQSLKRFLFQRCMHCGKRLRLGESAYSNQWDPPHIPWWKFWKCNDLSHSDCSPYANSGPSQENTCKPS